MKHMVVKTGENSTDEVEVYNAQHADNATHADSADSATKATQDGDGNIISSTYAKQSGTYPNITAGNSTHAASADTATNATNATNATKATQDGNSRNIVNTYAEKVQLPNPNLLLNPDFRVNQRGGSVYNSGSNNNYTYDRWSYWCDLSAPSIVRHDGDDYLSIINAAGTKNVQIAQYIDPIDVPLKVGEYYTMSAEYTTTSTNAAAGNFTRISKTFKLLASGNSGWIDFEGTACDLIFSTGTRSGINVFYIALRSFKSIYVRYIKLEQGQAATDFIPPIYSEELLKCQRYYYQSRSGLGFLLPITQVNSTTTDRRANFQFPVTMRRTPTVKVLATIGSSTNQSLNTEFVNPDSCVIIRNGYTTQSGHQAPEVTSIKADAEL